MTVTATWTSTNITNAKDTITVGLTSSKGTISDSGLMEFTAGTWSEEVTKTITITNVTGDDTITIVGANA